MASRSRASVARGPAVSAARRCEEARSSPAVSSVGGAAAGRSPGRSRSMSLRTRTRPAPSAALARSALTTEARAARSGSTSAAMRPPRSERLKPGEPRPKATWRTSPGLRSSLSTCRSLLASRSDSTTAPWRATGSRTTSGTREAICKLVKPGRLTVPLKGTSRRSRSSVRMSESSSRSVPRPGCTKGSSEAVSTKPSTGRRNFLNRSATRSWKAVQRAATSCSGSQEGSMQEASRGRKRRISSSA
mmetsp:Transcript_66621/g.168839  ORF Transcript_66621/g.168839 Transcript_66621/m.168839 type:complete len:246 (-) Transcript_66621:55-792(-)